MGFSDWVFSYLVILHLGVQGEIPPAFPSLAIAAKRKWTAMSISRSINTT